MVDWQKEGEAVEGGGGIYRSDGGMERQVRATLDCASSQSLEQLRRKPGSKANNDEIQTITKASETGVRSGSTIDNEKQDASWNGMVHKRGEQVAVQGKVR
jgi:hypothetical protein